jgi:hypothetical protein
MTIMTMKPNGTPIAQVQWLSPPPLWQELSAASDTSAFRSPSILRFATDTFMQDLMSVLASAPQTLRNYVARPETWRNPGAGLDFTYTGAASAPPFKLFQPAQLRYYLVASALACRKPGLPDHTIEASAGETVAFVVRQLRPKAGYTNADCAVYDPTKCDEYAWIPVTAGASPATPATTATPLATGSGPASPALQPGWIAASTTALAPGEEQIPLSLAHAGSNGGSRRIFLGLVPASRRQQYIGAQTLSSNGGGSGTNASGSGGGAPADPRMDSFYQQIVGPWFNLEDWWCNIDPASTTPQAAALNKQNAVLSSALILLDFATFLQQNVSRVWDAIQGKPVPDLTPAEATLLTTLGSALQTALLGAWNCGPQFESMPPANTLPAGYTPYALTDPANWIDPTSLQTPVANALPPLGAVNAPPLPPIAQNPSNPLGDGYFIVRCVYLRPQCRCSVVSPPTQPFLLANFFDPDAPARRIQVALPVDTSAAALRKYDKGVSFMISDELRNQMGRVASLIDLANGKLSSSPGFTVGWICSFSIPIITICALIILLVLVIALNFVFFWLPFFKICFPVPQLKAKR